MSFATVLAALKTHAITAGAAVTPAVTDVAVAHPLPKGRCVRIYYEGEAPPEHLGTERVLDGREISESIHVLLMLPLSTSAEEAAASVEQQLYDFKHAFRTAVLGDSQLGGASVDLEVHYAATDFVNFSGSLYRTLDFPIVTDYTEYPISP